MISISISFQRVLRCVFFKTYVILSPLLFFSCVRHYSRCNFAYFLSLFDGGWVASWLFQETLWKQYLGWLWFSPHVSLIVVPPHWGISWHLVVRNWAHIGLLSNSHLFSRTINIRSYKSSLLHFRVGVIYWIIAIRRLHIGIVIPSNRSI